MAKPNPRARKVLLGFVGLSVVAALAYRYSQRPVGGTNRHGVRWKINRTPSTFGKGSGGWHVKRLHGGRWMHAGVYDKRQKAIAAAQRLKPLV